MVSKATLTPPKLGKDGEVKSPGKLVITLTANQDELSVQDHSALNAHDILAALNRTSTTLEPTSLCARFAWTEDRPGKLAADAETEDTAIEG